MYKISGTDIYGSVEDNNLKLYLNNIEVKYNGEINIFGKIFKKDLTWIKSVILYRYMFYKNDLELIEKLEFVPYKTKTKVYSYLNILPIFKTPIIKVFNNTEYRRLARFPNYYISKNGELINVYGGIKKIPIRYNRDWVYPTVSVYDNVTNKSISVSLHKLVALAWVDNDDYYLKNIVDHIDKNKLNYKANNLRWISEGHNQAREIYGDKPAFQIRNIETGEITDFISQNELFRWNNGKKVNFGKNFNLMLYGKIWLLRGQKYEIKAYNDTREWWYKLNKLPPEDYNVKFGKNIQAKNIITNKVYEGSITDIIKITELSSSVIYKKLRTKDETTVVKDWLIRIKSDKPWIEPTSMEFSINLAKKIYVEECLSRTVKVYDSIATAAKDILVSERTISKYKDTNKLYSTGTNVYKFWSTYTGNSVSVTR